MKFGSLLKKELRELITPQVIFSMVFSCVMLIVMGQFMGNIMEDSMESSSSVTICNKDDTDYTNDMIKRLPDYGTEPELVTIDSDDYAAELSRLGKDALVVIPEGFSESVLIDKKPADIIYVGKVGIGFRAVMGSISSSDAISAIEAAVKDDILLKTYGLSEEEIERVQEPMMTVEFSVLSGKTAQISSSAVSGLLMTQSMLAPFIIFFLLLMASQMIMTAISTEKIDKTLETLLSAPVPRLTILGAKMTAALIVAILNSVSMVIGFLFYLVSMTGNITEQVANEAAGAAQTVSGTLNIAEGLNALGLTLGVGDYLLFGLQLFFSVAIGLSAALILGALAEDAKSVASLLTPIMITVMIPFFFSMFFNAESTNIVIKIIMYIIPFTHSYTALTNLMSGNILAFWLGLLYQIVFFAGCMFFAVRMFTSDRIFTMSGQFSEMMKNRAKRGSAFGRRN